MNLDPTFLASLFGGALSPDARQKGLVEALLARSKGMTEPAIDTGRERGIATLALLSGDPVLGHYGTAQFSDIGDREKRASEGRKVDLMAAMQAIKDQETQQERATDNARSDEQLGVSKERLAWDELHPPTQVVVTQGGQMVQVPTRTGTGAPRALEAPGGGALTKDKPLEQAQGKELTDLNQEIRNLSQLKGEFKDEYSGHGPGGRFLTALAQTAGGLAPEKANGLLPQFSQNAANFWSKFDMLVTLPQRNKTFGASLTPTESASWERAMRIKPGADPKVVRQVMGEMEGIARSKLEADVGGLTAEGYNPAGIQARTKDTATAATGPHGPFVMQKGVRFDWNPQTGKYE